MDGVEEELPDMEGIEEELPKIDGAGAVADEEGVPDDACPNAPNTEAVACCCEAPLKLSPPNAGVEMEEEDDEEEEDAVD
jgi:hypothetical protein